MIKELSQILLNKRDLSSKQMRKAMEEIISGDTETEDIVNFLEALCQKGESINEVAEAARVMREHAVKIHAKEQVILDTCGTGGDKKGSFNISTAVALVVSACGVMVAKHGNRSVSSQSGSADVLEALGVNITMTPQQIERCLRDVGIAFLFAPGLHPAMKHAMPARKLINHRTIFNILGPLCNPAQATHQLIGVYDEKLVLLLAGVLNALGSHHALVVHGDDGLDEITTTTSTFIAEVKLGKVSNFRINPEEFGLTLVTEADLRGGSAKDNAAIIQGILEGHSGPKRDIVILNAAASLYAAGKVKSIKEGIPLAKAVIDSQEALHKLEALQEASLKP